MYWHDLNTHLKQQYNCKVYKLSLSSGCSCPNRDGTLGNMGCSFCDGSGSYTATGSIPEQIALAKSKVAAKVAPDGKYIAYFQSFTNTYGSSDKLYSLFQAALLPDDIVALSIATRPDCLGDDILTMLKKLNEQKPVWVELGLQTIHASTARLINRGYELAVFEEAMQKLKALGITVIVHQILGLPGEDKDMMVATSSYIGALGADGIKLHLLHVLKGTELAHQWQLGLVPTLELDEYITILEDCLRHIPREMVIHRLTGDGDKKKLLAPLWSGNKKMVLNTIHAAFLRDNLEQGSLCK